MHEKSTVLELATAHADACERALFHSGQGRADLASKFERLADTLARTLAAALEEENEAAA